MTRILAIDPGNIDSAYVIVDEHYRILDKNKVPNKVMLDIVKADNYDELVIEKIACYGMPVGAETFDTCIWIGRFQQASPHCKDVSFVFRREEKMTLCNSMRAKDANIRQALIDRFATHDFKNGKGTKKNPDWFYGFKADIWAAYAVAVTYIDRKNRGVNDV